MLARVFQAILLFAVPLLLAACDAPQSSSSAGVVPEIAPAEVAAPTTAALPSSLPSATPDLQYLLDEIPPCTPVPGSSVDPCDPDAPPFEMGMAHYAPELGDEPINVREMLDGLSSPPDWVTHLIVRGTYLPGTVRCTSGDLFRLPSYLEYESSFTATHRAIKCYIDVRANAYVLGTGPSTVTVLFFKYHYWDGEFAPSTDEDPIEQDLIEEFRWQLETDIDSEFPGMEHVLFLGPPDDLSSEAWRLMGYWDLQRDEDGTVTAIHPHRDLWRRLKSDDYQTYQSTLEMTMPALTQAVTMAHEARVTEFDGRIGADTDLPMLVSNVNQLRQYYTDVGAYDPGVPTPAQPPPPCGLAVANQTANPGLMHDCFALLAAKDTLRGTETLNWSPDVAITKWKGITVRGTPSRVTRLQLQSNRTAGNQLSGSIPTELGELTKLTRLDLGGSRLTGPIPTELGDLSNLVSLYLSSNQLLGAVPVELGKPPNLEHLFLAGNSLSGCIPLVLRDVANHDMDQLRLANCTGTSGS